MILASEVPMPWGHVDADVFAAWGQWAGGVGSLAAVVVALWIAIADSRRRDRERRDHEAAAARTVTSKCEWTMPNSGFYRKVLSAAVTNHGPNPILDVHLESAELRLGHQRYRRWELSRSGSPARTPPGPVRLTDVIGPGADHVETSLAFDLPDGLDVSNAEYILTITFMDSDGLCWRRVGKRQPERVLRS